MLAVDNVADFFLLKLTEAVILLQAKGAQNLFHVHRICDDAPVCDGCLVGVFRQDGKIMIQQVAVPGKFDQAGE